MRTPLFRAMSSRRIELPIRGGKNSIATILCGFLLGLLPAAGQAQVNLLANPGFETGSTSGWTSSYGSYYVDSTPSNVYAGNYAAAIGNGSAVRQTVTGLTPNTTYVLSTRVKLAGSGSNASVVLGAQDYAAAGIKVSKSTNATAYSKVTLMFTTGPAATSATVFVYQSGATAAFCDDVSLVGPNLLVNPGFETGNTTGWAASYGSYSVGSTAPQSGTCCATVGWGGAVRQTVNGLSPNTTYVLNGWLKKAATAGQPLVLGVQGYGGANVSLSTSSTTYENLSLTFTTGSASTSATVFVYQTGTTGTNPGSCDDLSLVAPTGDASGTPARRIADALERFGTNTFSLLTLNGNPWNWGGSEGQYDATTTANAIKYIVGDSGLKMNIREYHRDFDKFGNAITAKQKAWIEAVNAATGSPFSLAIGACGGSADIPGIVNIVQGSVSSGLNYVKWVEGINEPNINFNGSGAPSSVIPSASTRTVQLDLWQQVRAVTTSVPVAGPSVAFALPDPENSLNAYLSPYQANILEHSNLNNLHVYPPKSPNADDLGGNGGALGDIDAGYAAALPGRPVLNTEFHPTLYSNIHRTDPSYDAYWGPIYLLSATQDFNWTACFWFALFDFHSVNMKCGLFRNSDTNPYPVATAFRSLFQLTGDQGGAAKLTFAPDKLNVTVTGLPAAPPNAPRAGGRWMLFQNSARTYFLFLWNEQNNISTASVPVTVAFSGRPAALVEEFKITSGSQVAAQTLTNAASVTVNLDTSLRLLRIVY